MSNMVIDFFMYGTYENKYFKKILDFIFLNLFSIVQMCASYQNMWIMNLKEFKLVLVFIIWLWNDYKNRISYLISVFK